MEKEYRKISSLKGWDKNPRSIKGQFLKGSPPHNKGMGMSPAEKKLAKKKAMDKYNSKPEVKERIKQWHLDHKDRVKEIKYKHSRTPKGILTKKANSHRRIARERKLEYKVNMQYFKWLCEKLHYICLGCGTQCDYRTITLDHQLPINRGGDNQEWNLMPLCRHCNSRKQDRLFFVDNIMLDTAYAIWISKQQ